MQYSIAIITEYIAYFLNSFFTILITVHKLPFFLFIINQKNEIFSRYFAFFF